MNSSDDKNSLVYLLAGFGLGALVGAAAGVLFAPKPGNETREMIGDKAKELKGRTEEWLTEQRAKRASKLEPEELGA
ncbi:MAG: YtxH domain-containing protein [Armatimonadetes bacterium]|nr:YtxH domain-containing protein [Armatimonadota bacterium]